MFSRVTWVVVVAVHVCLTGQSRSAEVVGSRRTLNHERPHATFLWYVGVGANSPESCIIGWTGGGDYRIIDLPGGQYWMAANEHGWYRHYFHDQPVTVPEKGTLRVDIHDRSTLDLPGFADLGNVMTVSQTFVATGTDLAVGMVLSASGGAKVRVTIREGSPDGPQIGPARSVVHGPLSPPIIRWLPGEVPLIPGRLYAVRQDSEDGKPFRPCIAYQIDPYPNGQACLDGVWRPEADLRVAVDCRDDGLVDEYRVDNGYRRQKYQEVVQTFVPAGQELRLAQMMLAGAGSGHVMRVSVHQWKGGFPLGPQIGVVKHARLLADFFEGVIWGPGELPLVPGETYAIRYVRADGGPFSVYGDADGYSAGKAYFDTVPDESDDLAGRMVFKEADKGDIRLSEVVLEAVSATEVRAAFKTDVPTTATVGHKTAGAVFETILPADPVPKTSHEIRVRQLRPGTPYDMRIWAYNPERNVLRTPVTTVTTRATVGEIKGIVRNAKGPVSGALVSLGESPFTVRTDKSGDFTLIFVPTGSHVLRAETTAGETAVRDLSIKPDSREEVVITLPVRPNLITVEGKDLMAGWSRFGDFDGQWKNGQFKTPTHLGSDWIGSVAAGVGGKKGGAHRTVPTVPGTRYRFGGWVLTDASDPDEGRLGGLAIARIGVDPTGGTDPKGANVIWARYRCTGNTWKDLSVSFTAGGARATLFAQHKFEDYYVLAPWWIAAFSDLYLVEDQPTATTNEQGP